MTQQEVSITIRPDGTVETVYQDSARDVYAELGALSVRRASHVEPAADEKWQADMSPVGGPLLPPTDTRQESLDAERNWLRENMSL
jgi:hypothetical protein